MIFCIKNNFLKSYRRNFIALEIKSNDKNRNRRHRF